MQPPLLGLAESLAPLVTVAGERVFNNRQGVRRGLDFVHFNSLAFELLVVEEEAAQHAEAMLWHLTGLGVGVELRIMGGNSDNLVVFLARINHRHQADGARLNHRKGHNGLLAQDEHVEWIIVFRQRLRNESVIRGIVDRRIEHAIELDKSALLVQFVLHAGAEWDFNDGIELQGQVFAGGDVVPGMSHERSRSTQARVIVAERQWGSPKTKRRGEIHRDSSAPQILMMLPLSNGVATASRFQLNWSTSPPGN